MHSEIETRACPKIKIFMRVALAFGGFFSLFIAALWLLKLHAYSELDASIIANERRHTQSIVLTEAPTLLGVVATKFTPEEPLEVKGVTGEFCLLLARDVDVSGDVDVLYRQILDGARLGAVLHDKDGKDYRWFRGGWRAPRGPAEGRGALLACLLLICNEERPPKGSEIVSIEVGSSRPLRALGANWYSSDSMDSAYESSSTEGQDCLAKEFSKPSH